MIDIGVFKKFVGWKDLVTNSRKKIVAQRSYTTTNAKDARPSAPFAGSLDDRVARMGQQLDHFIH